VAAEAGQEFVTRASHGRGGADQNESARELVYKAVCGLYVVTSNVVPDLIKVALGVTSDADASH
jgi:hypothetical protein